MSIVFLFSLPFFFSRFQKWISPPSDYCYCDPTNTVVRTNWREYLRGDTAESGETFSIADWKTVLEKPTAQPGACIPIIVSDSRINIVKYFAVCCTPSGVGVCRKSAFFYWRIHIQTPAIQNRGQNTKEQEEEEEKNDFRTKDRRETAPRTRSVQRHVSDREPYDGWVGKTVRIKKEIKTSINVRGKNTSMYTAGVCRFAKFVGSDPFSFFFFPPYKIQNKHVKTIYTLG